MSQLVFWSGTGLTASIAKQFNGIPLDEYKEGAFVLLVPSYGAPRTGNHVPDAVKRFLSEHAENMVGVIGNGNLLFGPEFCLGASKISKKFEVPLLAQIDLVPSAEQVKSITQFLKENT